MSISVTSDAVEITRLIVSAVTGLAWPVVVLVIAFLFRAYLAEVILRATGIEWGSFKVSFESKLETAEAKATQIAVTPGDEVGIEVPPLENLPPELLVLDAWRRVEMELLQLAERAGSTVKRGRSPLFLIRVLESQGVLDRQTGALLDDLRGLRNVAAHPHSGPPVTHEQAIRFRDLADVVVPRLRQLPLNGGG